MDFYIFFFSSRRRHTRCSRDWSSDVCSSDLFEHSTADEPEVRGVRYNGRVRQVFKCSVEALGTQALTHAGGVGADRSEEHTSELQSRLHLVCRLLLEKKKKSMHPKPTSPPVIKQGRSHRAAITPP